MSLYNYKDKVLDKHESRLLKRLTAHPWALLAIIPALVAVAPSLTGLIVDKETTASEKTTAAATLPRDRAASSPVHSPSETVIAGAASSAPAPLRSSLYRTGYALRNGRLDEAQKLADKIAPSTTAEKFVLARLRARQDRPASAAELYRSIAFEDEGLEARRIEELSKALLAAGNAEELDEVTDEWLGSRRCSDKDLICELHERRGDAWAKTDPKKAAAAYKKALAHARGSQRVQELRLKRGKALLAAGDKRKARLLLEPLAKDARKAWIMTHALDALEEAELAPRWSAKERLGRAERLKSMRAYEESLRTVEPLLSSDTKKIAAEARWLRARITLSSRQSWEEAIELLTASKEQDNVFQLKADLLIAYALTRLNRDREAVELYESIVKRAQKLPGLQASKIYQIMRLEFFSSNYEKALELGQTLLTKHKKQLSYEQNRETLFTTGMSALLSDKAGLAVNHLFESGRKSKSILDNTRSVYWRAVALSESKPEKAQELFHHLCDRDPTIWYSQLGRSRLEKMGLDLGSCASPPLHRAESPTPLSTKLEELSPAAAFLAQAGFVREAGEFLRSYERRGRIEAPPTDLVQHYIALESPQYVILRAYRKIDWPPDDEEELWWSSVAYPKPYPDLVENVEKKHGLPPYTVYAIARKESLFNPNVISYAGAMGLMQFMPQTYEENRKRAGLPKLKPGEIPGPVESLVAAGYELEFLWKTFGGQLPLVFSAYNGGPGATGNWLETSGDAPTDLFVEKIAFEQTRNYVRRCYQNMARYHLLDGRPMPKIPERIVKLEQPPVLDRFAQSN